MSSPRFTTRYDQAEDRIQLLIERPEEEVLTLWLTRRLLNRLLPPLLERLEGTGPVAGSDAEAAGAAGAGQGPQGQPAAVQRFQQEAAVSAIERQPAVTPDPAAPPEQRLGYLVTSIDIRTGPRKVVLDFKCGEDLLHSLPLGGDTERQWLSILYSQYRTARWAEPFWPSWMAAAPAKGEGASNLRLN